MTFWVGMPNWQEVLVNPALPRFVVLPTKAPISHSTELLSSPRVASLIDDLRERYESRIVIFDLPPLLKALTMPSPFCQDRSRVAGG